MKNALSRKNLWEGSPPPVRTAMGAMLSRLPLSFLLGTEFRRYQELLVDAESWSLEQKRAYQTVKLRELCSTAMHAPYWRRLFADCGLDPARITLEQLSQLPLLTRQEVRTHLNQMLTRSARSPRVDYVATSGSTGAPVAFYIGAERSPIEFAYTTAGWLRAGYRLGSTLAGFRGRPIAADRRGLRHQYDPLLRQHSYSIYHMSESNMTRYLEHISTVGECFLHGYPSALYTLAQHLVRSGRTPPLNVKGILTESETLYPDQRAYIESSFGKGCFSSYGQTEKVVAAAECKDSPFYHVWETYGICELVDDSGRAVTTPGARGEIVGTGFLNSVVPFLRYRTGDFATLVGHRCGACGREMLLLDDLRGHRSQEVLVAADRSLIPWTALNMHDDTFSNVLRLQFYQSRPGFATLRLIPSGRFTGADRQRIAVRLKQKVSDRVVIDIETVDTLPQPVNGKAVYVDQHVHIARQMDVAEVGRSNHG